MSPAPRPKRRAWIAPALLLGGVAAAGVLLYLYKQRVHARAQTAAASMPAPQWSVVAANATPREHRRTTTAVGTVVALQSITLHNELPGTVREAKLEPGQIVAPGDVLVALDTSVEEAELRAQQAQAALAGTVLDRMQRALDQSAASAVDVDRARAERDVALAQVERLEAIIARKTIRAPFRARVGMADVHPGQYLREGTQLTTLQGVDDDAHVEFMVTQVVAAGLRPGDTVDVLAPGATQPRSAEILAIDARVDPTTRNAKVRARLSGAPSPGASVRVQVPVGPKQTVLTVPVSALRKGPSGDHVFAIVERDGATSASMRAVRSGTMLGDDIVILDGLAPGDRVAASGSFKLYEGALVQVVPEVAAAARN